MNSAGRPTEAIPLQVGQYNVPPGHPGGPTMVQYTTVSVTTEPPADHIIWSLLCFAYSNPFCLGLAALIHSIKSRDRKMAGDMEGARQHGSTARQLNIVSTILAVIIYLILIITITVVYAETQSSYRRYHY